MKITKSVLKSFIVEELKKLREEEEDTVSEDSTEVIREYLAEVKKELGLLWDGNQEEVNDPEIHRATLQILTILEDLSLSSVPSDAYKDSTGTAYDDVTSGRDTEIEPEDL